MNTKHAWIAVALGALLGWSGELLAASLSVETFGSIANWQDRDVDEMDVTYNAGFGNPAGSLQGSFLEQDIAFPETDAFRAGALFSSSSGAFTGDYWTDVPTFGSWSFSFYADDVLPSDLIVRFGDGTSTFLRSGLAQVGAVDNWYTVTIPLTYAGWVGGSESAFSNALGNVTFVDVQVTRSGTSAQDYFIDNFALNAAVLGGGAVPEPTTAGLLLASLAVLRAARKRGGSVRRLLTVEPNLAAASSRDRFDEREASYSETRSPRRRSRRRKGRKVRQNLIV